MFQSGARVSAWDHMGRKIVTNKQFGGFRLTKAAVNAYNQRTGKRLRQYEDIARDDRDLIQVIEEMGPPAAGGQYCTLRIVEIPDDVPEDGWEIQDYYGNEWVAEKHRRWG
jgi:hypothetical protein